MAPAAAGMAAGFRLPPPVAERVTGTVQKSHVDAYGVWLTPRGHVPRTAQRRLSALPRDFSAQAIERLLSAFDRRTANRRRDYAIARCDVGLGLCTAEVAHLRRESLDWHADRAAPGCSI